MNVLEMIAKPIQSVKEALDLDPPSLTDQLIQIKNQLTRVQERLDESRAIEREKDALINELREAMKAKGQMVLEGDAYFAKRDGEIQDGPFCTCCADRDQQYIHLVGATRPQGQTGRKMDWVQCPQCQRPFRSKQAGEYLKTGKLPATGRQADRGRTSAKATPARTSTPKKQARTEAKTAVKPKRQAQSRTTKRASTSKSKSRRSAR